MSKTNKKMILNNNENNIVLSQNKEKMDINMSLNLSKAQLLEKCKELGITKCSSKTKPQLIELINNKNTSINLKSDSEENKIISEENLVLSASANEEQGQLRFIDLFCGIGGFHQALSKLGAKCVLACDIDKDCRTVYKDNYGLEPVSNIKEIDEKIMPDFDVLCGGFPCQSFSNGGKKLCFEDDRGLLFDEIVRIARVKKPKFMFLENVKHILKVSNGKVIDYIKQKIASIVYTLQLFQISPHNYGIPKQR